MRTDKDIDITSMHLSEDCGYFAKYKLEGSRFIIQVLSTEVGKLMTVDEVMDEIDREHGLL